MKRFKKINFENNLYIRLFVVISTILILALLFPVTKSLESEIKVGDIWTNNDLIATFSFPILKYPDELEKEYKEVEKSILPVFTYDDTIPEYSNYILKDFLGNFEMQLVKLRKDSSHINTLITTFGANIGNRETLDSILTNLPVLIDEIENELTLLVNYIYSIGYIDKRKDQIQSDSIFVRKRNIEKKLRKNNFLDLEDIKNYLFITFKKNSSYDTVKLNLYEFFVQNALKPNIVYNEHETKASLNQARVRISKNVGIVLENERIVSRHQRLTEDIKRKIDSYRIAKQEKEDFFSLAAQFLGKILHVAVILLLLGIYIFLFRKKVFYSTNRILTLSIIILIISFLAYITSRIESELPIDFLVFVPAASMLITIIFDSRLGFYGSVVICLIVAGIRGNDYTIAVTNLIAGGLSVYSVRDIKNRTQIFRSMVFILLGYLVAILAFGLERFSSVSQIGTEMIFAIGNSILSPVITYGLLIFFEKLFSITTDLTLLELSDIHHPLLLKLRQNAPGTFHHSVNVSILAETAAKETNSNSILAKAGALYHDIGKLVEPNYFIENIRDEKSEHENLDPEYSAQIILNHVEEGIKLAREYKLPQEIIDFIPMHHGTTQVKYFLNIAKKLGKKVDEDRFRYPGPKPNSKETGIVMIADVVESITRNLDSVNEEILSAKIDEIIRNIFLSGQLDETYLTLRDLNKIKESFVHTLLGFYHQRIEYPSTK